MSFNPAQQQPAPIPAQPAPAAPAPSQGDLFEPLRPQGTLGQDPAADGFNQFAGVPQAQQPQVSPDLIDQLVASIRGQGMTPQAQQPWAAPPQMPTQPPPQMPSASPTYDPNLLNEPVVAERLRNLELTYGNAYQQSQDNAVRQAILLAYHGERAQLQAQVEQARVARDREAFQAQQAQQQSLLEPVFRLMAAQILARELGIQDVNRVLNDPQGNPIWDARTMQINAMYQASASAGANIQQAAGRAIAPVPTGGQTTPDIASFTRTASREDFLRAVDQAKRTGIRVMGSN